VVGTIAPVEAAVQPVLATMTDTVGTLTNDMLGTIAPAETAAPTLLATGTDTALPVAGDVLSLDTHMGYLTGEVQSPVPDLLGGIAADTAGSTAPTAPDPVVADPLHAANPVDDLAAQAPATAGTIIEGVDPALAPAPGSDTDPSSVTNTSTAPHHIGSSVLVSGIVTPIHPDLVDALQAPAPLTIGGSADHVVAAAAPAVDTADPLLAAMTGAASQSTTLSQAAASDSAGTHTLGSSPPALDVAESATTTGSGATGDVAPPVNLGGDALANAGPVVDTTEPVLTTTAAALSTPISDVSHPADTGNVASDAAPVVDTSEPVLASAGVSLSNPATDLLQSAVPDTSTGHAPGSADTLLALATATDAPIEVSGSATAAAANVITDVTNAAAAVDPTTIAGDVIALNEAQLPPANALFTGTQYTDYGVTLSSDIAASPQPAVSPVDTASAQDTLVPVVADVQQHALPPPDIVDPTHPIDHLGLRDAIL